MPTTRQDELTRSKSTTRDSIVAEIRSAVLRHLYEAYFPDEDPAAMRTLPAANGWEEDLFWRTLEEMFGEGTIRAYSSGARYIVTATGILRAETSKNLSPPLAIYRSFSTVWEDAL